jgi:hypothetical protein
MTSYLVYVISYCHIFEDFPRERNVDFKVGFCGGFFFWCAFQDYMHRCTSKHTTLLKCSNTPSLFIAEVVSGREQSKVFCKQILFGAPIRYIHPGTQLKHNALMHRCSNAPS